jgi:hypothetical protein
MDTQETATGEQRRSVSTEDLVDWAHRNQQGQQDADRAAEAEGRAEQPAPVQQQEPERERAATTEQMTAPAQPDTEPARHAASEPSAAATVTDAEPGRRPATEDLARQPVATERSAERSAETTGEGTQQPTQLFKGDQVQEFRTRWLQLQTAFVDEPRRAVQQADELVAEVMQTLAATFAEHKRELEQQWRREGTAETEELRLALRRYRSFFDQLLHS